MVSRHSAFYSPLISAISAGFLQQQGLEPTYSIMTPQKSVAASWGPMERGEQNAVMHFAQINERDGFFIAGREPESDFTWDKLRGREVLVDHFGQPLAMFKYAAHKMGVDYDAINAIDAGDVPEIERAFSDGQGDYVHLQGPAPQQMEKDGEAHVVASVGEAIGPVAFSSLVATREWLQTDMALAFMTAYRQARDYVNHTSAVEVAESEADFFKGIDIEAIAAAIESYQRLGCWNPDVHISRSQYEVALDVFLHSNLINKRHRYEDVVVVPPDER
jgi:NitT/TauT family transport system substrate-binding protein